MRSESEAANWRKKIRKENNIGDDDISPGNWYISGYSYGLMGSSWRPTLNPEHHTEEHMKMWLMGWEDGNGDREAK